MVAGQSKDTSGGREGTLFIHPRVDRGHGGIKRSVEWTSLEDLKEYDFQLFELD